MVEPDQSASNLSQFSGGSADDLVMGTVNAPFRRELSPEELARRLSSGRVGPWLVHVANFFGDVRPQLILGFAARHGVAMADLSVTYQVVKRKTGYRNVELEAAFDAVARAA